MGVKVEHGGKARYNSKMDGLCSIHTLILYPVMCCFFGTVVQLLLSQNSAATIFRCLRRVREKGSGFHSAFMLGSSSLPFYTGDVAFQRFI